MKKIAIINDIHCNYYLLNKVIDYLKDQNITDYIIGGDSITDGFQNNLVLDKLKTLSPHIIKGNREESIINYNNHDWENNIQFAPMLLTYNELTNANLSYLKKLPMYKLITLENVKICISHGSPYNIRECVTPDDYALFDKLIADFNCDIYLFAHTHKVFYTKYKDKLFINVGSFLPCSNHPTANFGIIKIADSQINYSNITFKYNFEDIKNYYLNSPLYEVSPEWCNILIWEYKTGFEHCNNFIDYLNKHYKIIDDITWKKGFKEYMRQNKLDIY